MVAMIALTAAPALATDITRTTVVLPSGAAPIGIAVGPDGVWVTDPALGQLERIGPGDVVSEFPLPELDAAPGAIAAGPDGALWYTEPGINSIGRMTTAGVATDFPMSLTGTSPTGIAAGPDGNVWFTLRAANRIGWGDENGLQDVALTGTPGPAGITLGPDGAMWFTGLASGVIGRIDVATRAVTTFTLPSATSRPSSTGADGALWFTLRGANQIGRMTIGGVVTTFDVPTAAANPNGIAAAPGGALWFAETGADKVGRLLAGQIEEFAVGASPRATMVDGAGEVWVTEAAPGSVTRIHVVTTPPDTTPPTIDITSPAPGDWTVQGTDRLAAAYTCADETALASCAGDVPDGDPVPDAALGARALAVHAEDEAGNTADASASYLVFSSADGTLLAGGDVRPGAWLTLSLGMDLTRHADDPLGGATTQVVDCGSGAPLGAHEPAVVRTRVGAHGSLELRWDTDRSWSGCRTLTLSFSAAGWSGPEATFGPVRFNGAPVAKRR